MAATLTGGAAAAAPAYFELFRGDWTGGGEVTPSAGGATHDVSCSATGTVGADSVSIDGKCRTAIIFTRDFGASLRFDPETGRYSGTYIGSKVGPAALTGTKEGDTLHLQVTWPKEVNGDRTSNMTITANGGGFSVVMTDRLGADGPVGRTSDLRFSRQ